MGKYHNGRGCGKRGRPRKPEKIDFCSISKRELDMRYNGVLTRESKRNRLPMRAHKLSEKDHWIIIQGLERFVSLWQIAAKLQCGYSTLKKYISETRCLRDFYTECKGAQVEYVEGLFMDKIRDGNIAAQMFFLERKGGWKAAGDMDMNTPLPNIVLGSIPVEELPDDGMGEPEQIAHQPSVTEKENEVNLIEREEGLRSEEDEKDFIELSDDDFDIETDYEEIDFSL